MINIIMTTYAPTEERAACAQRVVDGLSSFLRSSEALSLHIADDGSPVQYTSDLVAYAKVSNFFDNVTYTVVPRLGIGGSLNKALSLLASGELWMYITDDWLLKEALNLDNAITLLRRYGYDYIRLGPIHAGIEGEVKFHEDVQYFLDLHFWRGGFCFATRPFLATRAFYVKMGNFPEKLDVYDTERAYSDRSIMMADDIKMAFTGSFDTRKLFEHIGESCPVGHLLP
jgi:hypothetical protein